MICEASYIFVASQLFYQVMDVDDKTFERIMRYAVKAIAIVCLTAYGIELARLGIDSQIALFIGAVVGGIAGYTFKVKREGEKR